MSFPEQYLAAVRDTLARIDLARVEQASVWFAEALQNNQQIFVCGNGGSASTSSHFVADMVKGASYGRDRRFRILALNENLSTITAYSNDVGYECIFAEQLKNFAMAGDLVMCLSGSGKSPNVVRAVEYANSIRCRTIALTGRDGGKLGALAQLNIQVPVQHMGRIEEAHLVICHMIAYRFMEPPIS